MRNILEGRGRKCKFDRQTCVAIRSEYASGVRVFELAEKYGASQPTIRAVLRGVYNARDPK